MKLKDLADEFCNTFEEFHYFAGGICIGFVLGWIAGAIFTGFMC